MLKFNFKQKSYWILDVTCLVFQSYNEGVKQKLNEAMSAAKKNLSYNPTVDTRVGNGKIFNHSVTLEGKIFSLVSRVFSVWTLKSNFTVCCFNSTQRQAQSVFKNKAIRCYIS